MHGRTQAARTPLQLKLAADLARKRAIGGFAMGRLTLTALRGGDALWLLGECGERPLFALRGPALLGGEARVRRTRRKAGEALAIAVETAAGLQEWRLAVREGAIPVLGSEVNIRPSAPLQIPFLDRDLIMLDRHGAPGGAGQVEAAQRGVNSAFCFLRLDDAEPFANLMYWQDLTALNPYFLATGTKPDGVVGGTWPELGFALPTPERKQTEPKPIPAGRRTCLSRAFVALHEGEGHGEVRGAERFLVLSAAIYPLLERPTPELRDWPARAQRSARDLAKAPDARISHYGHTYLHPYVAAEYPDSMVQITVWSAVRDWEDWRSERTPLSAELAAGLERFYDPKLKTLRRYLPNVGKDKNADAVDSWYLYYPLLGLGRLAIGGDKRARSLFERSIDFAINSARHFAYRWPIMYDIRDFTVITASRDDAGHGQTDVGGLYAMVMLLAFELEEDQRYLDEARAALDAARGVRFNLNYQANLTAWGAMAAMKLWRITAERAYLDLCQVYLASFLHNVATWESEIGHARHYRNFLGACALHDAPYMAQFECIESFAAFERLLLDGGEVLPPGVRLLLDEYCRYAIDRAWFYYPDALPPEALADKQRNGHLDRKLSFPVEDLYVDGQQAGQVGQEIYGVGAPFIFSSRCYHDFPGAPFRLFCDSFVGTAQQPRERALELKLAGSGAARATVVAMPQDGKLPPLSLILADGKRVRGQRKDGVLSFLVPADAGFVLSW